MAKLRKMPKTEWIRIRCTLVEKLKLRAFSESRGTTDAYIIREYIRRLPNPLNRAGFDFEEIEEYPFNN